MASIHHKYVVRRTDGKSEPGEKHERCEYFVLDLTHDRHAIAALRAYAESCVGEDARLSEELRVLAGAIAMERKAGAR